MYLQRFYLECLSHASYLVADENSKQAAVIDPQRDVDIYIEDARQHGFEIKYVILTHFHADFVAWERSARPRLPITVIDDGATTNETRLGAVRDWQTI